jgi:hypothetical protein
VFLSGCSLGWSWHKAPSSNALSRGSQAALDEKWERDWDDLLEGRITEAEFLERTSSSSQPGNSTQVQGAPVMSHRPDPDEELPKLPYGPEWPWDQALASAKLEGFVPDDDFEKDWADLKAGRITLDEYKARSLAAAKRAGTKE